MPDGSDQPTVAGEHAPVGPLAGRVAPRDAATVVLVRDARRGMETFLLRRVAGMAFAAGMTVFPGGGVDARDAEAVPRWAGPDAIWWADRFGCDRALATALVCAAVRETFEEAGVLLAGPDATSVVADTADYADARRALAGRELSLAEFLLDAGLVLRADLLRPWANWVTPVAEPRRYDTRFFLAALPPGQHADGMTTEADHAGWQHPAAALRDWRAGRRALLLPTWTTLTELSRCGSVAEAMATERVVRTITPRVVVRRGAVRTVHPDDPDDADGHAAHVRSGNEEER